MPRRPLATLPHISCDDACHKRRGSLGGTDYAVGLGTPVYAMFSGMARYRVAGTGGWTITINRDGNPHRGETMHLSRANGFVLGGASHHVNESDLIAWSGGVKGAPGSGSATGPHLHAHVYVNGIRYGMEEYLANPAWAGGGALIEEKESEKIMRVIYNKDATASQDDTRRAVVSDLTFKVITGPQSNRERKLWGDPVNFTQGEWDAQRVSVEENRRAVGLPPTSGTSNGGNAPDLTLADVNAAADRVIEAIPTTAVLS